MHVIDAALLTDNILFQSSSAIRSTPRARPTEVGQILVNDRVQCRYAWQIQKGHTKKGRIDHTGWRHQSLGSWRECSPDRQMTSSEAKCQRSDLSEHVGLKPCGSWDGDGKNPGIASGAQTQVEFDIECVAQEHVRRPKMRTRVQEKLSGNMLKDLWRSREPGGEDFQLMRKIIKRSQPRSSV